MERSRGESYLLFLSHYLLQYNCNSPVSIIYYIYNFIKKYKLLLAVIVYILL